LRSRYGNPLLNQLYHLVHLDPGSDNRQNRRWNRHIQQRGLHLLHHVLDYLHGKDKEKL